MSESDRIVSLTLESRLRCTTRALSSLLLASFIGGSFSAEEEPGESRKTEIWMVKLEKERVSEAKLSEAN